MINMPAKGARLMKRNWTRVAILGPLGLTVFASRPVIAQDASSAAREASNLIPRASSQGSEGITRPEIRQPAQTQGDQVLASTQTPRFAPPGVTRQSIASLRNPWEWGEPAERRGLLGWIGGQASPQAPPPAGVLGLEAAQPAGAPMPPGAFPGTTGAAPGTLPEAGAPSAPFPGTPAPGEAAGGAAPGAPLFTPSTAAAAAAAGGAADAFAAAAGGAGPGFGGGLGAASELSP